MAGTPDGRNVDLLKGVRVLIVEDAWHVAKALKSTVNRHRTVDRDLECTPASGQGQAADLTICRACSCSNVTGLRYPSAEWSRLLL